MLEKFSLYKGKLILYFDDGSHIYQVNGKQVYGVTNIVRIIDKPALRYWAVNKAIEYIGANLKAGVSLDEIQIKNLLNEAKIAHTKSTTGAADLGSLIHEWIEKFLKAGLSKQPLPKKPINKEMKNAIEGFLDWSKQHKVKFISSERKIYSRKHKYAGTLDAEAVVDGKATIIDFKTGNALYPESFLQAAAYLSAREEEDKTACEGGIKIIRLAKGDKEKAITPFEVKEVARKEIPNLLKVFLACQKVYSWQMANKTNGNGNNHSKNL